MLTTGTSLGSAIEVRNQLRLLGPNVVLEWAFLPTHIKKVKQLRSAGVEPWWFDGDESAARQGYVNRDGVVNLEEYETQVARIRAAWPQIEKLYRDHMIDVVTPGPTYLSCEEIWAAIAPPG